MPRGKGGKRYSGVKVAITKQYEALDGKVFDTPEEAEAHSAKGAYKSLYRMSEADIENILNGNDKQRAGLVLKLAAKIQRNMRSDPNYVPKRRPRKEAAANGAGTEQYSPA